MRINTLMFFLWMGYTLQAQVSPSFAYSFKNCNLSEDTNFGKQAIASKLATCQCGIEDEAISFDGSQSATFDEAINQIFYGDFTIDFYLKLEQSNLQSDILSVKKNCIVDSTITIVYLPQEQSILVELKDESADYELRAPLGNKCWSRITLVRSALNYILYINNVEVDITQVNKEVPIAQGANLRLSGNPCLDNFTSKMTGAIDQLKIYNKAVQPQLLSENYVYPDEIINKDTTIVSGSSVQINVGASCYDDFTWEPSIGLSNANELDPVASPTISTRYQLTVQSGQCIDTSYLNIYVIDPQDKKCDQLYFPSAFTPNNDDLNDDIGISNTFIIDQIVHYEILDRWGGRIAIYNDKQSRWDGTHNGKDLDLGSYFFNIRYTCGNEEFGKKGSFMLIR